MITSVLAASRNNPDPYIMTFLYLEVLNTMQAEGHETVKALVYPFSMAHKICTEIFNGETPDTECTEDKTTVIMNLPKKEENGAPLEISPTNKKKLLALLKNPHA